MESVPGATPVTKPLSVTVAIAVLLLLKCTVLIDAFGGETVALSWYVPPMEIAIVDGLIATPVTATGVIDSSWGDTCDKSALANRCD